MDEILIEDGNGENYDILAGDETCEFDEQDESKKQLVTVANLNNTQSSQEPEKQDSGIEDKDSIPNSPTTPAAPVSKLELHAKSWKPKVKTARQIRAERFHAEQKRKAFAAESAGGANSPQKKSEAKKSQVQTRKPRFPAQFRKPSFAPKPAGPSANRSWDPARRRSAPPIQTAFQRNQNLRKSPPKSVQKRASPVQKGPSPQKTGNNKKKKSLSPQKKIPMQMSNGQRQAIVKNIAPKKAKKSKSPNKINSTVDNTPKAKLVIDNFHITVNYKKGQRLMNVDSPVSIRKKQASQELLQMIQTKSPPKAPSTDKEKENASKHILGMINPFGSSNKLFKKPRGPPFQKQFAKKGNLKEKNAKNSSPGKFQKLQKNSQKRKQKIEDTRVVISEAENNSQKSAISEKIKEENLAETKIPQILVQEEEEVSAEEEATTVATVIEKTLVEGIENVTIKADE